MRKVLWLLPVLAITGSMLVNYLLSTAASASLAKVGRTDSPAMAASEALVVGRGAIEETFKGAVGAADKNGLNQAAEKKQAFKVALATLAGTAGSQEAARAISVDFDAYYAAAEEAASIMLGIKPGDVAAAAPAMQATQKALAERLEANKARVTADFSASLAGGERAVRNGLIANTAAAVIVLLVSLGVAQASIRHVLGQLGSNPEYANAVVQRMAGGNLAAPVVLQSASASSLLFNMKTMQSKLADAIADVRAAVAQIGSAAAEINAGNFNLSQRTSLQAASLDRSTQSLAQLAATVKQSAGSAANANSLARKAATVAGDGGKAVGDVVETMSAVSASSRKIVDIISVIDSIAFQTNILALNAAVEAARAGEQGRGFAVVASEVRTLAQRSAAAAKEIKGLIGDSVERVSTAQRQVEAAGATMAAIVDCVGQVSVLIANIAEASSEQSAGFHAIDGAIRELDGVTQQNAALVEQAAAGTAQLQTLAQQVEDSLGVFQLAGDSELAVASSRPGRAPANVGAAIVSRRDHLHSDTRVAA